MAAMVRLRVALHVHAAPKRGRNHLIIHCVNLGAHGNELVDKAKPGMVCCCVEGGKANLQRWSGGAKALGRRVVGRRRA